MKLTPGYLWGKILICTGALALLASAAILTYNIWDNIRAAGSAARLTKLLSLQIEENRSNAVTETDAPDAVQSEGGLPPGSPEDDNEPADIPQFIEIDGERFIGILSIPAFQLDLPVNDSIDEARLKETPCRYAGTINNSLVIAGHNYRKHFNPISKLEKGASVILTDAAGVTHLYKVEKTETVNATDITLMLDNSYDLTLFTCNYTGRARVAVRCLLQTP